ncbi:MAG TPA: response regulator, partial [Ignavibacteriaceae bacterium]
MKISCIITDDEPIARKGLQGYIGKIDFLDLKGVCEDAIQLNNLLKQAPIDLLFLDIEMPYVSGIEFLANTASPPKVIFTTAYERYAIKGYELDVLDYLLKPISFERFMKAANKAYEFFNTNPEPATQYLFVKT